MMNGPPPVQYPAYGRRNPWFSPPSMQYVAYGRRENPRLTAADRHDLPDSVFGLIRWRRARSGGQRRHGYDGLWHKSRHYPMPDYAHAVNAKGRATQQLRAGTLTLAEYQRIVRKADRVIAGLRAPGRVAANPSCEWDDEKCSRDLNQVYFGVVTDPDSLHPIARAEWENQRREMRNPSYRVRDYDEEFQCSVCGFPVYTGDKAYEDPDTGEIYCCKACAEKAKAKQNPWFSPPSMQYVAYGRRENPNTDIVKELNLLRSVLFRKGSSAQKAQQRIRAVAFKLEAHGETDLAHDLLAALASGSRWKMSKAVRRVLEAVTAHKNPWYKHSQLGKDDVRLPDDISDAELELMKASGEAYFVPEATEESVRGEIGEGYLARLTQMLPPPPMTPDVSLVDLECIDCGGLLGCSPKCSWWITLPKARRKAHLERLADLRRWFGYTPLPKAYTQKMLKVRKKANPRKKARR